MKNLQYYIPFRPQKQYLGVYLSAKKGNLLCTSVQVDHTFVNMGAKNLVKGARIGKVMSRRKSSILMSFPSSSAIIIVLPKYVVKIMRIINLIRDNFKHGQY